MKITLRLCKGSNSGTAFYLCGESGGTRIAGGKCWGFVRTVHAEEMDIEDLEELIKETKVLIKKMKVKYTKEKFGVEGSYEIR